MTLPSELKLKKYFFKDKIFIALTLLESLFMLILSGMPLFNIMDYESSIVSAFFHSVITLFFSVRLTRKIKTGNPRRVLTAWPLSVIGSLLILIPPFFIIFISGLLHDQCSFKTGLEFFFFYPVLSGAISAILGFSSGILFKSRFLSYSAVSFPFISLFSTLVIFYTEPPIFAYDMFFGYFSGAFYDRMVNITPTFFFARTFHILTALFAGLSTVFLTRKDRSLMVFVTSVVSGILVIVLLITAPETGFRYFAEDIQNALGKTLETPDFKVYYSSGISKNEALVMAAEAEFYHSELKKFFHSAPSGKINIYYFADHSEKHKLFGARRVEVAKPWLNSVFITSEYFPQTSLKHELAHVFAKTFGDRFFGVSFTKIPVCCGIKIPVPNPGLIEGIAVSAAFVRSEKSADQMAAMLYHFKKNPPLKYVFSPLFYKYSSSVAYVESGSFLRYVKRKYGFKAFTGIFSSGGHFKKYTGKTLDELEKEYKKYLKTIKLNPRFMKQAKRVFSAKPLIRKRCMHETAREAGRAFEMLGRKRFDEAMMHIKKAVNYDPHDSDLWFKLIEIARAAQRYDEADKAADKIISLSAGNYIEREVSAYIYKTRIAWFKGNLSEAEKYLKKADKTDLSLSLEREVTILKEIFKSPPGIREKMRKLLEAPLDLNRFISQLLQTGFKLSTYLAGKVCLTHSKWQRAYDLFAKTDIKDLPDENFLCEYKSDFIEAALLTKRFSEAERLIESYSKCPSSEIKVDFYSKIMLFWKKHPSLLKWSPLGTDEKHP